MQKLLVAESTQTFCAAVQKALCDQFDIRTCSKGEEVLVHIRSFQPDIMVLDLMMPGMDGIAILQAAFSAGFCPKVLAITRQITGYCEQKMVEYGVQHIMVKPCHVPVVAARIFDLAQQKQCSPEERLSNAVDNMLLLVGCRSGLSGYPCLRHAVLMKIQDPERMFTKEIYPSVAAKYGKTPPGVERLMRIVIEDAWKRRDDALWRLYFPAQRNGKLECPSNKDFITKMAACVTQELQK